MATRPRPRAQTQAQAPMPTSALADFLLARLQAQGITQAELCARAGVSRQTVHNLLNQPTLWPSLQTLFAVAGVLRVHPTRLVQLVYEDRHRAAPVRLSARRGDKSEFMRDVTFPDGDVVFPGQRFTKVWEAHNVGTVAWEGRYMQCMDEQVSVFNHRREELVLAQPLKPTQDRVPIPYTPPGALVQVAVEFTAPALPGTVLSYWKSVFEDGSLCFPKATGLWVKVQVAAAKAVAA